MAKASTSASSHVPQSRSSTHQAPNAPGTTAGRKPVAGMRSTPSDPNAASVAAAGDGPWPQTTVLPAGAGVVDA